MSVVSLLSVATHHPPQSQPKDRTAPNVPEELPPGRGGGDGGGAGAEGGGGQGGHRGAAGGGGGGRHGGHSHLVRGLRACSAACSAVWGGAWLLVCSVQH